MKTFSNLNDLFNASKGGQITAQNIINERAYINGEYQDIQINEELKKLVCRQISQLLGGRIKTRTNVYYTLLNGRPQHWGLERIHLENYHDTEASLHYCAGQDYPYEIAEIRKYLSK